MTQVVQRKPFTAIYTNQMISPLMVRNFMRFRKLLFIDRLGWDLKPSGDLERDEFDHAHAEYALLLHKGWIIGGFRATPINRPNISRDVFSHLASERSLPRTPDYWEISRFGVMTEEDGALKAEAGIANYAMVFHFAARRRARSLIALADLSYERFLRLSRIKTIRYGPTHTHEMGSPDKTIELMLGEIPVAPETFRLPEKFARMQQRMEFYDETLAKELDQGHQTVSA